MASATSKITACGCAYCAAEMDGELFRNLSEKLPFEGACPRLWCRAVFGVEPHVLAKNTPFLNAKTAKLSSDNLAVLLAMWRRGRKEYYARNMM